MAPTAPPLCLHCRRRISAERWQLTGGRTRHCGRPECATKHRRMNWRRARDAYQARARAAEAPKEPG